MTEASSRARARLLEILAAKIVDETGVDAVLARELAASALTSPSADEDEPVVLRDAAGLEVARSPFALVEDAFDELDDEEDGRG